MVFHSLVVAASSVLNLTSTENRFELEPKFVTHNSFFYTAKVSMDFIVFDCCASYTVFLASRTKRAICCRKHNNCTPLTTYGSKNTFNVGWKVAQICTFDFSFRVSFSIQNGNRCFNFGKKNLYAFECSRKKYFFSISEWNFRKLHARGD